MTPSAPPRVDRPLFFLDYDGTLAPIVDDPMAAYPHPDVPDLLTRLGERHPLWIVTGRHLRDLTVLLKLPLRAIGLHGAQQGVIGETVRSTLSEEARAALDRLRARVPRGDGVRVEDKGESFAVHYRGAADEEGVVRRLRAWLEAKPDDLTSIWGKKVVELRPVGVSKGVAVQRIAARYPERRPVYLGDDVTDEDAFETLGADAVTVKVGTGPTKARYRLPDVETVVDYLRLYVSGPPVDGA